jgi:uncharacterized protein
MAMQQNLLAAETSPYLLQHKDNPVHWRAWRSQTLAEAEMANKPILLSIGYAACHWCHVMAHECFENAEIAALMNRLFVNIKVDREERPDVDTLYQSALALMGQQGGWPLTMFLTPAGDPFWGGTYFPPTPRMGRPGFPQVLEAIAEAYHHQPDTIRQNVTALRGALQKMSEVEAGEGLTMAMIDDAASLAMRLVDLERGGTQGAPKFPQPTFFRFLWRAAKRRRDRSIAQGVMTTLDWLCQSGIYDHVGGGFSRYATDEEWLVPHFEKMLYDNALLIELLTEVWQDARSPVYEIRVRETIAWALRDLRTSAGDAGTFALASAYDADSEGVEGKYYVWTEDEIDRVLDDVQGAISAADAALFKAIYDVTAEGNWEGRVILNRRRAQELRAPDEEAALRACLDALRAARAHRVPPLRDDKVLADWNGLMIAALAGAAITFDTPEWLDAARRMFAFVTGEMAHGVRLHHVWCAGEAHQPGVLDDYAAMARAALALYEATGDDDYLRWAETWVRTADTHHWDTAEGGYFLSADDTMDLVARPKTIADHATPSGNGMMAEVLARLYFITGDDAWRARGEALVRLFASNTARHLISTPGLMTSHELLERGSQVVVIGEPADPGTRALHRAAFTAGAPLKVVSLLAPGAALPANHPAAGKTLVDGKPTAYVCTNATCGAPLTDPAALKEHLGTKQPV